MIELSGAGTMIEPDIDRRGARPSLLASVLCDATCKCPDDVPGSGGGTATNSSRSRAVPLDVRLSGASDEGVDGDREDSGIDGIGGAICHQLSTTFFPIGIVSGPAGADELGKAAACVWAWLLFELWP